MPANSRWELIRALKG